MSQRPHFLVRLRAKLLWMLGLAVLIYLLIAIWAGGGELARALAGFDKSLLPYIVLAVLVNYALRFLKWQYYLGVQGVRLSLSDSLAVFLAAFSMAITPGKVGELLKAQLVKQRTGVPRRLTVPIVLAERITDLLALLLLSGLGALTLPLPERVGGLSTAGVLWLALLVPLLLLVVLMSRRICLALIAVSARLPVLGRHSAKLAESYRAMGPLITPVRLIAMTFLSVLSWGGECLAYYLVWQGLTGALGAWQAGFIYAFSTIAGVVAPGGLGPTEGFLVALPLAFSPLVERGQAVSAMGLIRAATLWFAVVLGLLALVHFARRYRIDEPDLEPAE